MLLEGIDRLISDSHEVIVVDPDGLFQAETTDLGHEVKYYQEIKSIQQQ